MLKSKKTAEINQTDFVDQLVMTEEDSLKEKISIKDFKKLKKNKNLLPFYILGGFLLLLVLLTLLLSFNKNKVNQLGSEEQGEEKLVELNPFQEKINLLKIELEAADPRRQPLPFPQVDLEFNID